jgi:hypothetical protein
MIGTRWVHNTAFLVHDRNILDALTIIQLRGRGNEKAAGWDDKSS